jgi:hypothetical protein
MNDELERLLDEARESSPDVRLPTYRDAIAAHGAKAIEPLLNWIDQPVLAAFAIRSLERIATLASPTKAHVIQALRSVDRTAIEGFIARDLEASLRRLGVDPDRSPRRHAGKPNRERPVESPGVEGRGYWAMRTSPWERTYIWAEARAGRLRQGWGWAPEQNLEVIAAVVRRHGALSEEQQMAWPSRRMLSTEPDGMRLGDLILSPNIPEWGRLSIFRLIGSYEFAPDAPRRFDDRFGHILPVALLVGDIDRHSAEVSDALRITLRNPSRLWGIGPYGGDVERLVDGNRPLSASGGNP